MPRFDPPLILTAQQWGMPGPLGPTMRLPIRDVFLHHTVTPVTDDPLADARGVAAVGIRRFGRMSYNVLVHPARVIFWAQTAHQGVHTPGHNSSSLAIALVGNYEQDSPPATLTYDACLALHQLRQVGVLAERVWVRPHSSVKSTACPGKWARAQLLPYLEAVGTTPTWTP